MDASQRTESSVDRERERERERERARLDHLRAIGAIVEQPISAILDLALDAAVKLTDSALGYIYFYDEETRRFTLHAWSGAAMKACAVQERKTVYELDKTGLWGEAVRQRRTILVNDCAAPHPDKRGTPEGHVALLRFLTVPVFEGDGIVAVVGVANKGDPYDDGDAAQLDHLMQATWQMVRRHEAEAALRETDARLSHASQLAALGTLASGMAHEINNPLAAAFSILGSLRRRLAGVAGADPGLTALFDQQSVALQRIVDIVDALRAFARADREAAPRMDLHAAIADTLSLMRGELEGEGIAVTIDLGSRAAAVKGNFAKMSLVIVHLLTNARDGIRERGGRGAIRVETRDDGASALLAVTDDGVGIREEHLDRVIEPFFTTKPPGQGVGLGLSVVHTIVRSFGGELRLSSRRGEGARVEVRLPHA